MTRSQNAYSTPTKTSGLITSSAPHAWMSWNRQNCAQLPTSNMKAMAVQHACRQEKRICSACRYNPTQPLNRRVSASEVITVTAQKRVENIQDVPLSIAAVSGKGLIAKGVNDVAGLIAHPHLRRISVETPSGPVSYPAPAPLRDQARSYGAIPRLGEHTERVKKEFG